MGKDATRGKVKSYYGKIAAAAFESGPASCCGEHASAVDLRDMAVKLGYDPKELDKLPAGANLGLGCGNPAALARLKPGDQVLDLGSGGGLDCILASALVGPKGVVVGVDMTPEMLAKAKAATRDLENVEFRLGEIERLPVQDNSMDVVVSNCVINLSQDKNRVYEEIFRVLRPGGRLCASDSVRRRSFKGTKWEGEAYLSQ